MLKLAGKTFFISLINLILLLLYIALNEIANTIWIVYKFIFRMVFTLLFYWIKMMVALISVLKRLVIILAVLLFIASLLSQEDMFSPILKELNLSFISGFRIYIYAFFVVILFKWDDITKHIRQSTYADAYTFFFKIFNIARPMFFIANRIRYSYEKTVDKEMGMIPR